MNKKFIKRNFQKFYKKWIYCVTFKFIFAMIYIIHKMLVLLKIHLNYIKDSIFKCFYKEYNRLLYFFKNFFTTYNDGKFKS